MLCQLLGWSFLGRWYHSWPSFFLRCTLSALYISPEATENDHIAGELFNLCTVLIIWSLYHVYTFIWNSRNKCLHQGKYRAQVSKLQPMGQMRLAARFLIAHTLRIFRWLRNKSRVIVCDVKIVWNSNLSVCKTFTETQLCSFMAVTAFRLQGQSLVIVTDSSQTWNTYYEHLLKMFADLWFRRADQ